MKRGIMWLVLCAVPFSSALGATENETATIKPLGADEVRALVYSVLADADMRSSLLDKDKQGGWDDGFYLSDDSGRFKLELSGQMQFRWIGTFQDDTPGEDSTETGFVNRRTKLSFDGYAVDPAWEYHITGGFSRKDGGFGLQDAYVERDLGKGWSLKFGQFKAPFMREELISSKRQLAVARSLVNETFNQGRSQGIELVYKNDHIHASAMFSDGFDSANVAALEEDVEFGITARVEFLIDGKWKQFKDFTSWEKDKFAAMVGGAVHYEEEDGGGDEETFTWTVDGSIEFGGANLFAAIVGRHMDMKGSDQYGFIFQGGAFLNDDWEAFARYEWGDIDKAGFEDLSIVTVGVNRYYHKHALKWTTDIGYAFDRVRGGFSSSGTGWLTDPKGADGQIVIRSQIQFLF